MSDPTLLFFVAALLVLLGLAGLILPALPGVPLIFLGLCAAAWAEGFQYVGGGTLAVLAGMAAFAYAVDFAAGALGVKRSGASRLAIVGAVAGTIVGLFLGIPGVLLGPFVGAAAGELIAKRDLLQAGRAGFGAWIGIVVGVAVKIAISFSMLAVFTSARLWWR